MNATLYTYLFIRMDLSIPQQIVQAAHAALGAGHRFGAHSHLVLIGVGNEDALLKAVSHLTDHRIEFEIFFEPDNNVGYTAACTCPLQADKRRSLRKFQLMKQSAQLPNMNSLEYTSDTIPVNM